MIHPPRPPRWLQTSTTSTTAKPSPTPIKLSTPSYKSTAIWYATTGFVTACNVTISNNDDIIALPAALYSNGHQVSDFCGQSVLATNPATGAQVTLKVASASWRSEYTIVTRNTFIALGGVPIEGELPISFQFVRATVAKDAVQEVKLYAISSSSAAAASSSRAAAAESVSASIADAAASKSASLSKAAASKSASIAASASAASSRGAAATAKAEAEAKADAKADADEAKAHSSALAASAAAASEAAEVRTTTTAPKKTTSATPAKEETTEKAKATPVKAVVAATTAAASTTTSASSSGGSGGSGGSSSGGGSGEVHSGGYATFYTQNGVAGNCGTVAKDSDYVIALPTAMYANGAHCGKKIVVTRVSDGAKVTATVRDSCPSCVNNECLDLSVAAFTAIATEAEGMVSITWQWA
ncbi:BQ2448_1698 [Microbotryum intermedium]|uniref:BQ2448_1698 protein n=1 Tax=Microbotryum intermedium TaxID=269621 RepID=A0A238FEK0_9BASI|nr:BQ2448_1698 [Microbotryum intermedium]